MEKTVSDNPILGPKYPHIRVPLVGEDGNAFMILARVAKALRRAGVSEAEVSLYNQEAMSGDYDNLISTTLRWVDGL